MAVETRQLRIKARKLGATNVREMSRDELEDYIAEHSSGNGKKAKGKKAAKAIKAAGKNKVKRGRPRKVVEDDDDDEDVAPRKRGRPKGSKNKTTAKKSGRGPGRPPKAENERKQSRKATSSKKGAVGRPPGSGSGTRVSVPDVIKWNRDFDFREGSTAQYILNALRKAANKHDETSDVREATFDRLVDKINKVDELTFNNRATGKPHKGEKAEQMLRYRINRTIFDYAVETGQHDANGGNSTKRSSKSDKTSTTGKNKVKRGPGRPRKVVEDDDEDEAPKKRGRPKGSKTKKAGRPKGSTNKNSGNDEVAALKARLAELEGGKKRGRPKGSTNKATGKKRGRPKGSKNKVRA